MKSAPTPATPDPSSSPLKTFAVPPRPPERVVTRERLSTAEGRKALAAETVEHRAWIAGVCAVWDMRQRDRGQTCEKAPTRGASVQRGRSERRHSSRGSSKCTSSSSSDDPGELPPPSEAATVRLCPGPPIGGEDARRYCGAPLAKPKRGPWPSLCLDCKIELDTDRKRQERREEELERHANKTLRRRLNPSKAGRVPGLYRTAKADGTVREIRWTRSGGDVGVARQIGGYGGTSTYDGGDLHPAWYLHPRDCRSAAGEWERRRELHMAGGDPELAEDQRQRRIIAARLRRITETERRLRKQGGGESEQRARPPRAAPQPVASLHIGELPR